MPYRIHVPIIVQCQGNGCSLSSKGGAVIQESFGQLKGWILKGLKVPLHVITMHPMRNMIMKGQAITFWKAYLAHEMKRCRTATMTNQTLHEMRTLQNTCQQIRTLAHCTICCKIIMTKNMNRHKINAIWTRKKCPFHLVLYVCIPLLTRY